MEIIKNENIKAALTKAINFLDDNYTILIAIIIFVGMLPTYLGNYNIGYKLVASVYWFAAATAYKDRRKDVRWITFLILSIPFMLFIGYIEKNGYAIWGDVLHMEVTKHLHQIDLNPIFRKIPFNDGAIFRIYKNNTLTWFLRLVYNNGFELAAIVPIYRAIICKDFRKMIRYLLSAHVLQIFLISPFYIIFHLQEVWYVLGQPDGLARHLSPQAAAGWTLNCFPSMHTSIAFAMFLLTLREKDKIFKFVWGFFCLSVIYSTLYLEVHWVIDVIAGLILAYCTVKLVDFILAKLDKKLAKFKNLYYRKKDTIFF